MGPGPRVWRFSLAKFEVQGSGFWRQRPESQAKGEDFTKQWVKGLGFRAFRVYSTKSSPVKECQKNGNKGCQS